MKPTTIYLPKDQIKELKHIAVDRNISLAELIRQLVADYLEEQEE